MMLPREGLPHPPSPAELLGVNTVGKEASVAPREAAQVVLSCWNGGFQPWLCCHPRFGVPGNPDCWGGDFTAVRCCNETSWEPVMVAEFHQVLQMDWGKRCDGQRDIYDGGRPAPWVEGLYQELVFYFAYLRAGVRSSVRRHALEFAAALNPETPLDERLRRLLARDVRGRAIDPPRQVRILDVGSGPLSLLGYSWPGIDVQLVAADPLACEYGEMRRDLGLEVPPMAAPRAVEAERLTEMFGPMSFDIVHCTNALDHSHDPVRGMAEMLRVVRRGRPVSLQHSRNEAEKNGYAGLHQWNLDMRSGRFVAWQPASSSTGGRTASEVDVEARLVADGLLAPGELEVRVVDAPYAKAEGEAGPGRADWVEVVLWRRSTV